MFKNIFKRKKHHYIMRFTERDACEVIAHNKYGAAKMMWDEMAPNPSQSYPEGRGYFGNFEIFWGYASKSYGIIEWGQAKE